MGKTEKTSGTILINSKEAAMTQFRKVVGFVPQDDIMLRELTVYENILHSANVRLPPDWTSSEIQNHTRTIASSLG